MSVWSLRVTARQTERGQSKERARKEIDELNAYAARLALTDGEANGEGGRVCSPPPLTSPCSAGVREAASRDVVCAAEIPPLRKSAPTREFTKPPHAYGHGSPLGPMHNHTIALCTVDDICYLRHRENRERYGDSLTLHRIV